MSELTGQLQTAALAAAAQAAIRLQRGRCESRRPNKDGSGAAGRFDVTAVTQDVCAHGPQLTGHR